MDVVAKYRNVPHGYLTCMDMHTCGEPTRIVMGGFPKLKGPLLTQRALAREHHEDIRKLLMLEPRGHYDMYGALLRPVTELTEKGEADIGVLFMTNDGYSTMCGHASIALGRLLVDTQDVNTFPRRKQLKYNAQTRTTSLRLHAPCGVVELTVPSRPRKNGTYESDPTRPVSFVSVGSFATGLDIELTLKSPISGWPVKIKADFAYGGAFYCLVDVKQLPLQTGLRKFDLKSLDTFSKAIIDTVKQSPELAQYTKHPKEPDLSFLYSVIFVDQNMGQPLPNSLSAETGLCFFADQQVDRSPTGSGVSARLAASFAKGTLGPGKKRTYHSLVSYHLTPKCAFEGEVIAWKDPDPGAHPPYATARTRVSGFAYYTGIHQMIVENEDKIHIGGFTMQSLASRS